MMVSNSFRRVVAPVLSAIAPLLIGCAPTPAARSAPQLATACEVFDARRYIPDEATFVSFIDNETLNASVYGPSVRRWLLRDPSASREGEPFLQGCATLWVANVAVPEGQPDRQILVGTGKCAAHAAEQLQGWTVHDVDNQGFVAVDTTARAPGPVPAANPLRFDVTGKAMALRFSNPMLADLSNAANDAGLPLPNSSESRQLRVFLRLQPTLNFWFEYDLASNEQATALEQRAPAVIRQLETNIALRTFAIDKALRRASVSRRDATVLISVSLMPEDAQHWVASVDKAIKDWQSAGATADLDVQVLERASRRRTGRGRGLLGGLRKDQPSAPSSPKPAAPSVGEGNPACQDAKLRVATLEARKFGHHIQPDEWVRHGRELDAAKDVAYEACR